jgi:hypothetical protein
MLLPVLLPVLLPLVLVLLPLVLVLLPSVVLLPSAVLLPSVGPSTNRTTHTRTNQQIGYTTLLSGAVKRSIV